MTEEEKEQELFEIEQKEVRHIIVLAVKEMAKEVNTRGFQYSTLWIELIDLAGFMLGNRKNKELVEIVITLTQNVVKDAVLKGSTDSNEPEVKPTDKEKKEAN